MRRTRDLKQDFRRFKMFNRKVHQRMVKKMEYDVKNGDQTTLDSFK